MLQYNPPEYLYKLNFWLSPFSLLLSRFIISSSPNLLCNEEKEGREEEEEEEEEWMSTPKKYGYGCGEKGRGRWCHQGEKGGEDRGGRETAKRQSLNLEDGKKKRKKMCAALRHSRTLAYDWFFFIR